MKRWAFGVAILLGLVGVGNAVHGAILFSESFTGAQLATDPRGSFPIRIPVVQGSSLFFDTSKSDYDNLFVLTLLPGNVLSTAPATIDISIRYTVQQSAWETYPADFDPRIGVGDGRYIASFIAADNANGQGVAAWYRDLGTEYQLVAASGIFTEAGYPAIGQPLDVHVTITLFDNYIEVYGAFGSEYGSQTLGETLDRSQPLSLVLMAHDSLERYKIESLSVEVDGTAVPEPSSLVVWTSLGAVGAAMALWHRRRAD